jgi:hypothetical protein
MGDPKTGELVWGNSVDLTIEGSAPQVTVTPTSAAPGQLVSITDGGGCGPGPWRYAALAVEYDWVQQVSVSPDGRWGPVQVQVPPDLPDWEDAIDVTASCWEADTDDPTEIARYGTRYRTSILQIERG